MIQVFFYGLPRATRVTHTSIDFLLKNFVGAMRCGVFVHKEVFSNNRTKEFSERINFDTSRKLLSISHQTLLSPDSNEIINTLNDIKNYGNAFDDDGSSLNNLIEQLYTLKKCRDLYIKKDAEAYIFVRPDLMFFESLSLDKMDSESIYLPRWQSFGGFNDRFAVTKNFNAAKVYANRLNDAKDYCLSKNAPLHSESLLLFALKKGHIKVRGLPIRFKRVRNNGDIQEEDFKCDMWKTKIKNFLS